VGRSLDHVMAAVAPKILAAIAETKQNCEVSIEITVQIRDDSGNAKISQDKREDVLVDLSSGVKKSVKSSPTKTNPQAVLEEIKEILQDRLFTNRVAGMVELTLCFKSGNFTKILEQKNQRSTFALAGGQGKISEWSRV